MLFDSNIDSYLTVNICNYYLVYKLHIYNTCKIVHAKNMS